MNTKARHINMMLIAQRYQVNGIDGNIIEIVWRKIKYKWLPFSAYESIKALEESLFEVLANIGEKYHIDFAL